MQPHGCAAAAPTTRPACHRRAAAAANLFAMAALRASMAHIGSLSSPTVAEGLNTICMGRAVQGGTRRMMAC